jgi:AAA+ ATPase superfamily predicted ATPase
MFRTSGPVTAAGFHDRESELTNLVAAFDSLAQGVPAWVAIIGRRKLGKTSLLLEAARRVEGAVSVVVLDVLELAPLTVDVFRMLLLRVVDAFLSDELGASVEHAAHDPDELRRLLDRSPSFGRLPGRLRTEVRELCEKPTRAEGIRRLLQLPEALAVALDRRLVVAIDELQELASLASGRAGFDPFPVMRAVWQRHERVGYVISGSAPSMLEELVTSRRSPFFQHFRILKLEGFSRAEAVRLLVEQSPSGREIPSRLAERCVDFLGGNPFYLQLAGESLVADEPPYDDEALKQVLQSLVFSPAGRLGLFFQNEHRRIVGNATTLAATLDALAGGGRRLTEIARTIGSSAPSVARYCERLGDVVVRRDDGTYELADPVFASWLRWRGPGGAVVPMRILGDEAELAVAEHMAAMGFELVYQSRASKGAFDLLALRGSFQLGLQVKRGTLPVRFDRRAWNRMGADAERWAWSWAVANVSPAGRVLILDPARARVGRGVALHENATIENVLLWLER